MFRPRVIPVLLVEHGALVKTQRFGGALYVGDPINAVRIFSELEADELIVLDIAATRERRCISAEFVRSVGEEAGMPFAAGGGIRSIREVRELLAAGAEKVVLGSFAAENPSFVRDVSNHFGASTIIVCVDVRRDADGRSRVFTVGGTQATSLDPVGFAKTMETMGAGEVAIQSIDRDGMRSGYDVALVREVSQAVTIPVIALGGAGSTEDLRAGYVDGHASALAAGSLFVLHGPLRGVLISYPESSQLRLT
jgi:cyclase